MSTDRGRGQWRVQTVASVCPHTLNSVGQNWMVHSMRDGHASSCEHTVAAVRPQPNWVQTVAKVRGRQPNWVQTVAAVFGSPAT